MTNATQIKCAIKRNRLRLICIVSSWLLLALLIRKTRNHLPKHISLWALKSLRKAEISMGLIAILGKRAQLFGHRHIKADRYLPVARQYLSNPDATLMVSNDLLYVTLDQIIHRLKNLLMALRCLGVALKKSYFAQHHQFGIVPQLFKAGFYTAFANACVATEYRPPP